MKGNISIKIENLESLPAAANQLLGLFSSKLVLFKGDLGSGKTTLIKELIAQLGCADIGSSPSYSIINNYLGKERTIYHMDLFRLNNLEEAFNLGIEEILYSGSYCFIEWPELILDYLTAPFHILQFYINDDNSRTITLHTASEANKA